MDDPLHIVPANGFPHTLVMQEAPRFDNEQDRVTYELGSILRLLGGTPYRALRLASIEAQLLPPIRLRQTSIVRGPRGHVLGYANRF